MIPISITNYTLSILKYPKSISQSMMLFVSVFLSWLRYFFMAFVVSVSGSFIFKVLFMIVDKVILMSSRLRLRILASELSQIFIDNAIFLDGVNVHVSNW